MRYASTFIAGAVALLVSRRAVRADYQYTLAKLPFSDPLHVTVSGMNDLGQVVGEMQAPYGSSSYNEAFIATSDTVDELGTLGGTDAGAVSINDAGQFTAWVHYSDGSCAGQVLQYGSSSVTVVDSNMANWNLYVSNTGKVLDTASVNGEPHPVLYQNGTRQDLLPTIGGIGSFGWGISSNGAYVVGEGDQGSFLYHDGNVSIIAPALVGIAGVNNAGEVIISPVANGKTTAFVYSNGVMNGLPQLDREMYSGATAINDDGSIVGYALLSTDNPPVMDEVGFVYKGGST
jgi:probable HAF family extracellular repeat protein